MALRNARYAVSLLCAIVVLAVVNPELLAQPTYEPFIQDAMLRALGALLGETSLTLMVAWTKGIPFSSMTSWPDKLCLASTTQQGEQYVSTEHVLRQPFLAGGTLGASAVSFFHLLSNKKSGNHAAAGLIGAFAMRLSLAVVCSWVLAPLNKLADSPLRLFLKGAVALILPAVGAGVGAAYGYQFGMRSAQATARIKGAREIVMMNQSF